MKHATEQNSESQDVAEKHLHELIKQAGEEARERKRKAMDRHFKKIKAVVAEAASRR
ncbi:MAG: hypothetical protein GY862_09470 [Gammaproteobacteria bacterium]|nr:hypothetical protein [Gammaproteobacteria bacterium]